jgi:FKBP-type peptidyl-prolyl cis-trans isomerase SlyD
MSTEQTVEDGQVVTLEYTLRIDGEIMGTTEGGEPIKFIQGAGNIIPGLESELYGMEVGQSKEVHIDPEEGYGLVDEDAYVEVSREQFPPNMTVKVGVPIQVQDQNGNPMQAVIDQVGDESVRLNFNHPLAGKELDFSVLVAGVREATDEEMEHQHVHDGDEH